MPTGYTTVSATHLQDANGGLVTNATIYFAPVDNHGNPVSFLVGGTPGVSIGSAVSTEVTNGAFSLNLADTSMTTPVHVGYAVSIIDNLDGAPIPLYGYGCFQPTGATLDFDTVVPNLAAQVIVQVGPAGPAGPAGANGTNGTSGANGVASPPEIVGLMNAHPADVSLDNKFNKATITQDVYVEPSTGNLVAWTGRSASYYMPANAGGQMVASQDLVGAGFAGIAYYKGDKTYLSGDGAAYAAGAPITIPNNAVLMRVTLLTTAAPTMMVVNGTGVPGTYQGFGTYPTNVIDAKDAATAAATVASRVNSTASLPTRTLGNLFDPDATTRDHAVDPNNGTLLSFGGRRASDFILANAGGQMITSNALVGVGFAGIAYYDGEKRYTSGDGNPYAGGATISIPANAVFMRVTTLDSGTPDASYAEMLYWGTTLPGTFQAFGTYPKNIIDAKDLSVAGTATSAALVDVYERIGLDAARNLLNWRQNFQAGIITNTGGVNSGAAGFLYTEKIYVGGLTQIVTSVSHPTYGTAFYDFNGVFLGGTFSPPTANSDGSYTIPVPAGAFWMRTSIESGLINKDLRDIYIGPGNALPAQRTPYKAINSPWAGKSFGVFGDSYSYANIWQPAIAQIHGMTKVFQDARVNRPIGPSGPGATNGNGIFEFYSGSATGVNNKNVPHTDGSTNGTYDAWGTGAQANSGTVGNTIAQDIAACDLMFIALGMNSFEDTVPLGSLADTAATASSYGYIRAAIEGVQAAKPGMRIVWIEPPQPTNTTLGGAVLTGTTTSGSAVITAVSDTSGVQVGQHLYGVNQAATGIPSGAKVVAVGSGIITMSANATGSYAGESFNCGFYRAEFVPIIVKAIRDVCATYAVPVIRMWSESGLNGFNAGTMLQDGIHCSSDGWYTFFIPYLALQLLRINPFGWAL